MYNLLQHLLQKISGMGVGSPGNLLGSTGSDYAPSFFPSFGAEVNNVISRLDDIQVMFDNQDTVAGIRQAGEDIKQLPNISKMEPGSRLVENI